ncbi:hypothetical protein [Arthrobacter sp. Ld5]|uniref:hypothetical protein n=1 Tax=Arthrobacter sp. Ld5 TaxID=649152 RepID=UPI003EBB9B5F
MPEAYYPGITAGDAASIQPDGTVERAFVPSNSFIQVFELSDTAYTTPLTIRSESGLTRTDVPVGDLPVLPDVYVQSPNFSHKWKSGDIVFRRDSQDAKDQAVSDALAAVQLAATNAGVEAVAEIARRIAEGEFKGNDGSNVVPTAEAIAAEIQTPGTPAFTALSATIAEQVGAATVDLDVLNGYAAKAAGSPRLEAPFSPAKTMPNKPTVTFGGSANLAGKTLVPLLRMVRATLTNGSAALVAVEGVFTSADVGKRITCGSGAFPSGNLTITAVANSTSATMSAPAVNNSTAGIHFGEVSSEFTLLSSAKVGHGSSNGIAGTFGVLVNDTPTIFIPAAASIAHEVRNVSEVFFYCYGHPTADRQIRVMIDTGFGYESATPQPIMLTKTASPILVTLNFGAPLPLAKIRWEFANLDSGVQGIYVPTAELAGKAGPEVLAKTPPIRSVWLGDSYLETGYGGPTGTLNAWSAPSAVASKLLGYAHTFNRGQGGTGWLNDGTNVRATNSRARNRLAELDALAPDVLVIAWVRMTRRPPRLRSVTR